VQLNARIDGRDHERLGDDSLGTRGCRDERRERQEDHEGKTTYGGLLPDVIGVAA
jgi:hypothetical protein